VIQGYLSRDMTEAAKNAAKFLKSTLRLPKSSFPPRPPPADLAKYLPRCTDDLYEWQARERPAGDVFILHDGPPYANGDLHVGHALNKILKDIICRTKLSEGKRINYVPGWDCHGLPIELKALEHHGWRRGQGVDAVPLRKAARAFAQKALKKQMSEFKSWAIMGDWQNHWKTMDKSFELRQLSIFRAMAQHGLIYRKHKPVYWSPSSGTALAEAELEYKDDHVSTAALVKFRLHDTLDSFEQDPLYAVIWTTTPWTLPANQAIALNKGLEYSRVWSNNHGMLLIAKTRLPYVEQLIGEPLRVMDESVSVESLLQTTYSGPSEFGDEAADRPIIHADFVSAESGTGLVHCAPGHGMEDYEALQPQLKAGTVSIKAPVDNDGRFTSAAAGGSPELLTGKDIFSDGNETVLSLLATRNLLLAQHPYKHKYPIDWRTKEPVIIRATAQWFADVSSIKQDTLQALDAVKFYPETGSTRLRSFVGNRSEWCISRQRAWGVPIPAIYHKETGEAVLSEESIDHITKTIKERGIDAWWSDSADEPAWITSNLVPSQYVRGRDTMDVWFDSGTSWTAMQGCKNQEAPLADVYIEGTDQHRGWFQSSLLTSVAFQKATNATAIAHAPFRTLITHGFTLDAQGKKMSKSLGNVIEPSQIIAGLNPVAKPVQTQTSKKHREIHPLGPDALRLWVASSDYTKDVVISTTVVKTVHTSLDKYRVIFKLLLGLLDDFSPSSMVDYRGLSRLDQIALLQLHQVSEVVSKAYADFEFHKAVTAINRWVASDLSSFYFEAIKDVMYCESQPSGRRRSAQTALYYIFARLQDMLAPVTPLLVEESWEHSPAGLRAAGEHPLRRLRSRCPAEWKDETLEHLLPSVMLVNSSVKAAQEEARSRKLVGQSLASDVVILMQPGSGLFEALPMPTWQELLVVSGFSVMQTQKFTAEAEEYARNQGALTVDTAEGSIVGVWSFRQEILGPDNDQVGVAVATSPAGLKCARCWRFMVEKNEEKVKEEQPLCGRCEETIKDYQE